MTRELKLPSMPIARPLIAFTACLACVLAAPPARAQIDPPLSPQQSLERIQVPPELRVQLVAAEPLTTDPVAIDFGPDGCLWVCEMHDYPSGLHGNFEPGGRVRILRDDDGDGVYDRSTIFLDRLPFPTGVTVWRKGVLAVSYTHLTLPTNSEV